LFGGPLFFLGIVSPYSVKLYSHELNDLGKRVGHLYAVSTVGSCAGSLVTGFFLIPHLRVDHIFYFLSAALFALWGIQRVLAQGTKKMSAGVPAAIALLGFFLPSHPSATAANTTLVEESHSLHGLVRVEDRQSHRYLLIDGAPNSAIDKKTGFSLAPYIYYLEILPYFRPEATQALLVGLGGGSLAMRLSTAYGLTVDAVEIDPNVVRVAKDHFQYSPGAGKVFIEDARRHIQASSKKYDFVITDVFSGDLAPYHLFSQEAIRETKSILKEGGIFAINFIGYLEGPQARVAVSLNKTLRTEFSDVRFYPRDPSQPLGNVIILASNKKFGLKRSLETCPIPEIRRLMAEMMVHEKTNLEKDEALILRDNFNPMQTWGVSAGERWRSKFADYVAGH
jgi:spermidine synthase